MKANSASKNIVRQGSILVVASILVRIMNLAYRIPIMSLWGDKGLGTYSDAYQIYSYFLVLASYSIPATMAKMIGERLAKKEYCNANKVLKCALKVVLVIGIVSMMIMMAFNHVFATAIFNNPDAARPIFWLGPTVLLVGLTSVISGYFQGRSNMKPTSLSVVFEGALHAVFSVVLAYVLFGYGIDWSVTGGIFGTTIGAIGALAVLVFCYVVYKHYVAAKKERPRKHEPVETESEIFKKMIKLMIPIVLSSTIFSVKSILDATLFGKLMISMGVESGMVVAMRGIYSGKFVVLLNLPIAIGESFGAATVPAISASAAKHNYAELKEEFTSVVRTSLIVAVPFAIGMIVMGKPVLRMLFSSAFLGGELFWVGAFAVVFYSINYVATAVLQGLNRPQYPMITAAVGVLLTCLMAVINIRVMHMGIFSLAFNTLVFSFFIMMVNMHFAMKFCHIKLDLWKLSRGPLLCAVLMGIACILSYILLYAVTGRNIIATIGAVGIGVVTYFGLMINLKIMTEHDIDMIPGGHYLYKMRI